MIQSLVLFQFWHHAAQGKLLTTTSILLLAQNHADVFHIMSEDFTAIRPLRRLRAKLWYQNDRKIIQRFFDIFQK